MLALIQQVEADLRTFSTGHPGVRLLRSIPGVGVRTAETVMAYVDDPRRFGRNKTIGSYFGVIPRETSSGKTQRLGHITCDGPATVRKMLIEAAWQAIRRSPTIRARYERIKGNKPGHNKVSIVAIGHYLARVMLAMLRSGEVWREATAGKKAVA